MRIGVISDTHNYLDPRIPGLFAGVEHILHAGDIGLPSILLELQEVAPVTAVSGNTDDPGFHYLQTQTVELADRKFLLHHIVNPHSPDDSLQECLARERPDVVVFGHTHKPFSQIIGEILFFNPGYAGKPRFGMERSVAILEGGGNRLRSQYFTL